MRAAFQSLPETVLNLYLVTDGFADLRRFLVITYGSSWDDVPIRQTERILASPMDHFSILKRPDGDYLFIDPVSGEPVDHWSAKQLRWGMYQGETPFLTFIAHRVRSVNPPRTIEDAGQRSMSGAASSARSSRHHTRQQPNLKIPSPPWPPNLVSQDATRDVSDLEDTNRRVPYQQQAGVPPEVILIS